LIGEIRSGEADVNRDIVLALILLLFAALYWAGADGIVESGIDSGVGAQALPKGLAYALAGLSVLLLVQAVARKSMAAGEQETDEEHTKFLQSNHARAFGVLVIGALYLAVVTYTGYLIGLFLLMGATALYMGRKPSLQLAGIMAAGALFYWLLFVKLLGVPLPGGILAGLGFPL
jgi:hypothetical protein